MDVTGTIVRNNTVYFAANAINSRAYYVGERGSNYVVTNNIGYYATGLTGGNCYHFDLANSAYDLVSNNLCFGANFDVGTINMDGMASTSDPLFIAAPNDLRLGTGSPAIDSGTSVSAAFSDILGTSIRGSTPDRGAYEAP